MEENFSFRLDRHACVVPYRQIRVGFLFFVDPGCVIGWVCRWDSEHDWDKDVGSGADWY